MRLNVSRLHFPVTALGPGSRAGLWVQGCTLGCPGCLSHDTWSHNDGTMLEVDGLVEWLAALCSAESVDGLTISGGEPTEQCDGLHALLGAVDDLRDSGIFTGDVLCYTGLDEPAFMAAAPWAPRLIDAVITGRFQITEPTALLWRGSANQRLVALSERGRLRYADLVDATSEQPAVQVTVSDGQVWMIGIPRRGDLQRIEATLRTEGVVLGEVSWRPR
jgi:anaerobic ribonucleoside-triphosphate reductase activating protein